MKVFRSPSRMERSFRLGSREFASFLRRFGPTSSAPVGRGAKTLDYAALAAEYVELVNKGRGRTVNAILGERHHLSPSQVTTLISEAVRRGLKEPPPVRGMAGGNLTPKAIDLLRERAS